MSELSIENEEQQRRGAFFITQAGKRVGEMSFTRLNEGLIRIDHTHVDEALRGTGASRKLLDATVAWARQRHVKVLPVCSYAKAQFDKDASLADVRAAQ